MMSKSSFSAGPRLDSFCGLGPRAAWWIWAAALSAAIVGCTATKPSQDASGDAAARGESGAKLPGVELTAPLLFQLVSAEVAIQRGEVATAYATLMKIARDTGDPRLARRATEVAVSARAAPEALEAASLWRRLDRGSAEADHMYSALLLNAGRYDEARDILQRQLKKDPDPVVALSRVQRLLARTPDPARAFSLLETLAAPYRDRKQTAFDVRLILAHGAHAAGNIERATQEARAALALKPDSEQAVISTAQFMLETKGSNGAAGRADAISLLSGFLQRTPSAADARLAYARLLIGDGRNDAARAQFEELLKRDENGPDPLFALGVLAMQAEMRGEARSYFERYLKAIEDGGDRDPDPAYLNLAHLSEEEQKYDDALQWLHRVHSPDQLLTAKVRESYVLSRMGRVEAALKMLREQKAETPDDRIQLVLVQGQILREAHRYQESYDLLDKALQGAADDPNLLYEAAMSAERLDRLDVMETDLRRLVKLRPDYAHAYNALGYTFADRNIRLQEAYELIDKALQLAPDDGFILDSMGWVQYRLGNLSAARDYLKRAYALKPEADVAAHLGEVMWNQGERDEARTLFRDASKREADNETLKETLQRLDVKP
jgi:tetratricopeptide (TPR) repeat protein